MSSPVSNQHPSRRDMLKTVLAAAASVTLPGVLRAEENQSLNSERLPKTSQDVEGRFVVQIEERPLVVKGADAPVVAPKPTEATPAPAEATPTPAVALPTPAPKPPTPEELKVLVNKQFEDAKTSADKTRALFNAAYRRDIPLPDKKHILNTLKDSDARVVSAALSVVMNRRDMPFEFKEVLPLVGHTHYYIRAYALRALANRDDIALPGSALRKLEIQLDPLKGQHHYVRRCLMALIRERKPQGFPRFISEHYLKDHQTDAALLGGLELLKSDERFMKRTRSLDIVRCHRDLSDFELEAGDGLRLGQILLAKTIPGLRRQDREEAKELAMPLLNFISSIDERYPGYFDCVGAHERDMKRFCVAALECILTARREEVAKAKKTATVDKVVMGLLHDESAFVKDRLESALKELAEVGSVTVKKIHQYDTVAEDREMMLWWMGAENDPEAEKELLGNDPKKKFEYLADLEKMAEDTSKQAIVWNSGHGGPRHFWMSAGNFGDHKSNDLHHPGAISYKEMAMVLVRAQTPYGRMASGTSIDLSHMTIVNDACIQFEFVKNLHDEMFKVAGILGVEIKGLPRMISVAQQGMPSWIVNVDNYKARGRVYNSGSYLQNEMGLGASGDATLTPLEKLLATDASLRKDMDTNLSTIVGSRLLAQDMAVFSSRVWDLDTMVEGIVDTVQKRYRVVLPPLPEKKAIPASKRHLLQISRVDEPSEFLDRVV